MVTNSDLEAAVKLIQQGDTEKFRVIIEGLQNKLFKYCFHLLGDLQEAEDATQEVLIKIYKNIHNYKISINFVSWCYKICYNHCLNIIRRRKLLKFLPYNDFTEAKDQATDLLMDNIEAENTVLSVLGVLSGQNKAIVILRIVEQKSFSEISVITGKKEATVRKSYERSINKLQEYLTVQKEVLQDERLKII